MTAAAVAAIIRRRERKDIVTEPFELISVDTDRVACDGGGGALGHPKVYLNLGEEGRVECPYCSRTYVLREGVRPGHGAGAPAH
ncbi:zinc-finger domain-containing protein [Reyranella sp.]|uniref:zinc-finger domain-containing protein n=1 Tax=Reyranella sp. TaxID=1929291 RepID=UPI0037838B01